MIRPVDAWIASSLAIAVLMQMAFLTGFGAIPSPITMEAWLVTSGTALLVAQAWRIRGLLPKHTDMLLLMGAWGGLGMLLGWQLDGALEFLGTRGAIHGPMHGGWHRWVNAMNALMILFAFPPSILWARCLRPYRCAPWYLVWVLMLDGIGMILGMAAGARLLSNPLSRALGSPVMAHHLGMLLGMITGMALTMTARPWLAPLSRRT